MTIMRANIDDKVIEKIKKLGQVIEVFPGEKVQTGKVTQWQWLLPIKGRLRLSYGDEKSQEILHSDINATFPVLELPIGDTVVPGYQLTALERGQVLILPLAAFREIVLDLYRNVPQGVSCNGKKYSWLAFAGASCYLLTTSILLYR